MMNEEDWVSAELRRRAAPETGTTDLDAQVTYPHWTDERYRGKDRLIFGTRDDKRATDGAYSDRLVGWDYEKSSAASKQAAEESPVSYVTYRRVQRYLSLYHEREVILDTVICGVNQSNGYPWYYYRWHYAADSVKRSDND